MAPEEQPALVPAWLSFSYEEAKRHLVEADPRFEDLFERLKCTPFEELEMSSDQIYNRATNFVASSTENYADYSYVASADVGFLRAAGLSGRKAEYVQDLAARFADGRLSTEKLLAASDQELADMLIAVKGIGPWE
ncbi:hypothetical protein MPER_01296, partial [Moniliophthora perniciosa FA553]